MYKLLPKLRVEDSDDNCRLLDAKWPTSGGAADSAASPPLEFLGEAIFAAGSQRFPFFPLSISPHIHHLIGSYLTRR